jgi:UDP-N-acetylmuramoyl-L-alanyl-D-glutamate--2,6-diaminopimelate ligase
MIQELKNYLWHWPKAVIAGLVYGFPSTKLTLIGVTGTKGKTTTSHLIYFLLKESGYKVGLISTIGAYFNNKEIDTGLHVTSPDPMELNKLLKLAVDSGIKYVVLEVTSNGLDQFRVWGLKFAVSVITNINPDHLDYHKTMEKYVDAKSKIIKQSNGVVINRNIPFFSKLAKIAKDRKIKLLAIRLSEYPQKANLQAATEAIEMLGLKIKNQNKILMSFPGVPGRMETVFDKKFKIIIDFAHTPESLQAALREIRLTVKKGGRLIAVFGCAGKRDHGRRRMGAVAARSADFFVITAEDPRTENVEDISEEISAYAEKAGATAEKDFILIPDRQEAINYAISIAKTDDVIGLFGKGHEKSMCFGKTEIPWSEHEAVKKALKLCVASLDT